MRRAAGTLISVVVDVAGSSKRQTEPGVVAVESRALVVAHLTTENSRRRRVGPYTLPSTQLTHHYRTASQLQTYTNAEIKRTLWRRKFPKISGAPSETPTQIQIFIDIFAA